MRKSVAKNKQYGANESIILLKKNPETIRSFYSICVGRHRIFLNRNMGQTYGQTYSKIWVKHASQTPISST